MILINNDVLAWNLHKKVWPIEIKLLILHKNYTRKNVMDELKWNNKDVMNHYDSNSRHRFNYASSLAPILAARGHENAHNGEKHLFWCAASHPCRWCNDDAVTGNEYGLFSKLAITNVSWLHTSMCSFCAARLVSESGAMPTSLQRSTEFMDCSPAW